LNKKQLILVGSGFALFAAIFFLGSNVAPKKPQPVATNDQHNHADFDIQMFIDSVARPKLNTTQQTALLQLENSVKRGDVKAQQLKSYQQLAIFWRDSATQNNLLPYAFYNAEASKLENSEKSLTFAARYFLDNLRGAPEQSIKTWMANQAKTLFERSLEINPQNDSNMVGLGACNIFGSTSETKQQTMEGIQKVLAVAKRDSTNMYAQFMLGIGGVVSGQLDKATIRFEKVLKAEPNNLEAMAYLADTYETLQQKPQAIKWYQQLLKLTDVPEMKKEIEIRLKTLQQ
jgi:tetratricopeptide (TPR) repeat protein